MVSWMMARSSTQVIMYEVKTDSASRSTFKKGERLSSKKLIDELFKKSSSFYLHPFKIIFAPLISTKEMKASPIAIPVRVLISVSKKNFRRAVDRNKIKRLIREAYRTNKHLLYKELNKENKQLIVAILYTSKTMESFNFIRQKIIGVLVKLAKESVKGE